MVNRITLAAATVAVVVALAVASLSSFAGGEVKAVSPSERDCIAAGGTFDRTTGDVTCVTEENVGNSDSSATTTDTTGGQGNTGNKTTEACTGPGASDSSAHCK